MIMKASVIIGNNAYAVIKGDTYSMDVLLNAGRSASQSLRESAAENRAKAERLILCADRMIEAAELLKD